MPLGSQEGETGPQALEILKAEGDKMSLTLRDLALVLEDVSERYDSAMVDDVLAVVATSVMDRAESADEDTSGPL